MDDLTAAQRDFEGKLLTTWQMEREETRARTRRTAALVAGAGTPGRRSR